MTAQLIVSHKSIDEAGGIIQMIVWKVPAPIPPTTHGFKYRLVYVRGGRRLVGFDNERGKGDHMHLGQTELRYTFTTIDQLVEDFITEVEIIRGNP
jgi:hypothetical protein